MREKIKMFVDEVLKQIPEELPDDAVALEVATRILENEDLVTTSGEVVEIVDRLTELAVDRFLEKEAS